MHVKQEEGLLSGMSTVPISLNEQLIINRHTCHPRRCLDLRVPGRLAEMNLMLGVSGKHLSGTHPLHL